MSGPEHIRPVSPEAEPIVHDLIWDEEKVKRFWDYNAKAEAGIEKYFSRQVGPGVVSFLRALLPLEGRILDYGCGPGFLVECLLDAGIPCEAIDMSRQSVDVVNRRLAGRWGWGGARLFSGGKLPYDNGTFNVVICLETIEHVLPQHMNALLSELRRCISPETGRLFFTTPNSEDLKKSEVFCTECGCVFHPRQHLRSFTAESLAAMMAEHGFRTVYCDGTDFGAFQRKVRLPRSVLDWNGRWAIHIIGRVLQGLAKCAGWGRQIDSYRLRRRVGDGPHLFWVGGVDATFDESAGIEE